MAAWPNGRALAFYATDHGFSLAVSAMTFWLFCLVIRKKYEYDAKMIKKSVNIYDFTYSYTCMARIA